MSDRYFQQVPERSSVMTEEGIFSLEPIIVNPAGPAGGELGELGDGTADLLALELKDSGIAEVLGQTLLMNSECTVADIVRDEGAVTSQQVQPANSDVLHVQWMQNVSSDDRAQVRTPKKGRLEREMQGVLCLQRERQAEASSVGRRPIRRPKQKRRNSPELERRWVPASVQRSINGLRKPIPGRRWRDIERERAQMAVMYYAQRRAALSMYSELCRLRYVPSAFPNSRLKHPFRLSTAATTPMPNMYAVLNSSDFAIPEYAGAVLQQATVAATKPGSPREYYTSERPIPSSTPVQELIFPSPMINLAAPMTLPPAAPMADHFTWVPTTRIDPIEVSMAALERQVDPAPAPNHISEQSIPLSVPVQFFENQRHPTV